MKQFHSGFVTIIGRPNAGKSTLLNALLKKKIAIISPKAQTTRNTIQGIYNDENHQIIFIDTPGLHKPHSLLEENMNEMALGASKDVECILYIVDAMASFNSEDEFLIEKVSTMKSPVLLVLNKIDKLDKKEIYDAISFWKDKLNFANIIPISALKNDNLDKLLTLIKGYMVEGPKYYPEGITTDHPESFIMAELIREKILFFTQEEIPHAVAVYIEKLQKKKNETIIIDAVIAVERDSQKGIIIGKNGVMLKKIKETAKKDIESILGNKIELSIFVKVESNWRNSPHSLKNFGY